MKRLFGTDGIRGIANAYPLTIEVCLKLSRALYKKFLYKKERKIVLIGKDTRISGDIFEHALAAGFCSMGVDVMLLDVIPTPAVSIFTKEQRAGLGIMISASHNPYYDNGIKIFNSKGLKLTDDEELELEKLIFNDNEEDNLSVTYNKVGEVVSSKDIVENYIKKILAEIDIDKKFAKNLKVVIDSANGALSKIALKVFKNLGCKVISLFDSPNGVNINENCGVTHPEVLSKAVIKNRADFGIAFDGDGDRVLLCDDSGKILDGDDILAILSSEENYKEVVSTVMSNFGFEKYLNSHGIKLIRTNVGDRYISEYLQNSEATLGGEPSGHIIIKSHAPTGDGLFAGLKIVEFMLKNHKKMHELRLFGPFPSVNKNIKVLDKSIIENSEIQKVVKKCKNQLKGRGKLIVRPSGTEPLIRVTAEGENIEELKNIVNELSEIIEKCR